MNENVTHVCLCIRIVKTRRCEIIDNGTSLHQSERQNDVEDTISRLPFGLQQ